MKPNSSKDSEVYRFASLENYGLKDRFVIRFAGYAIYLLIKYFNKTLRFEAASGWDELGFGDWEEFQQTNKKEHRLMLTFWHDRIFFLIYHLRKLNGHVMISKSYDGEYIARAAQRFGYGAIRGSGSRDGVSALKQMIRLLKNGKSLGLTVDGPRGPRHESKKGTILLSRSTGVPIIPLSIEARNYWLLKSWDKTVIPKPFSKAKVFWGSPLHVPRDADPEMIEMLRLELDKRLDELVQRGKEWRIATQ